MRKTLESSQDVNATELRRVWVRPAYSRVRAGDAEIGPNTNQIDGAFTFS